MSTYFSDTNLLLSSWRSRGGLPSSIQFMGLVEEMATVE